MRNRTSDKTTLLPDRVTAEQFRAMKAGQKGIGKRRPPRRQYRRGEMNATEREYARRLELLRVAGEIEGWVFESGKLDIAERCTYTPDFFVQTNGDRDEYHEVKGFRRDDAIVKFKVARRLFPIYKFRMFEKRKGAFVEIYKEKEKC